MNVTLWPINTASSMVTPSQMNVWLEILQLLPIAGVLLNFDEGTDFGVVADRTAVHIDEFRQLDVFAELDVGRDASTNSFIAG